MSNYLVTESNEGHERGEISEKRGSEDEGNENGEAILEVPPAESLTISTTVCTAPVAVERFMFTDDFVRLLVGLVMEDTLMTLRLATKAWKRVVDTFIDEGMKSGVMIVHVE